MSSGKPDDSRCHSGGFHRCFRRSINGAWTGLLTDWLDQQGLAAPDTRDRLARYAPDDIVPVPVWRELLASGLMLAEGEPAPELAVGACVQPHHVGFWVTWS
ncbi:MAG: hypothetical protein R6W87_00065 [Halospina sp.]